MQRFRSAVAMAAIVLVSAAQPVLAQKTRSIPVGKCINLGNTFEPPAEAAWGGRPASEHDLENIAKAGFDTIRIPVRWDTHAGGAPDFKIDDAYMARVEKVVTTAQAKGLNVILNSHHFERIHKEPLESAAQLAAMWKQIANRFADHSKASLWFEIENEPHDKFDHSNLLDVLTPALKEIRKTNADRPVIIGGERWSGIDSLATLPLPDDPHIIPTFHYYDPFDFTHQGASWVDPAPKLGRVYGSKADTELLQRDVAKVQAYIARTGLTPFMGETGAHTTVSLDQRVAYHSAVTKAFQPTGIGMCMWAYSNTFPFYDADEKKWLPGLLGAIGLKEK
jgi:endoglucanase